jgi:hypothetical protein
VDLALQICSYAAWLPLIVLTITALLRAGPAKYPILLAYLVVSFLTTAVEIYPSFSYYLSGRPQSDFVFVYWVDEGIREVLIFSVVVSLLYGASARVEQRRTLRFVLIVGGLLFVGISFLVHYSSQVRIGVWMTPWTRDLKFCAAILDLGLWALLLASRQKDQRLLLLTGAMGLMFTGEAIGESIRSLAIRSHSHLMVTLGGIVILVADLAFLYIWWQAFRKKDELLKPSFGR